MSRDKQNIHFMKYGRCNGAHCKCAAPLCSNFHNGDHVCDSKPAFRPADEYWECDDCAAKVGSPVLCEVCLHNRGLVADLNRQVESLAADLALVEHDDNAISQRIEHVQLLTAINGIKDILTADKRDEGPTDPEKQPQAYCHCCLHHL